MDSLYFVVHTHWDREWYQPFQQMRSRLVAMADRMIPLVERDRDKDPVVALRSE